jgi:hypothetical protein
MPSDLQHNQINMASSEQNMAINTNRRLHFAYAWPLKRRPKTGKQRVIPPFPDAEPWQCSVYYYWWEYLRRHEGYRETCARGGTGAYAELFADFGDVHSTDFWTWWRAHNHIFAEPPVRQLRHAQAGETADERTLILSVPLDTKLALTVGQFKRLVRPLLEQAPRAKTQSRARYPVAAKPILPALHEHLMVWDARQADTHCTDWELADKVGLRINHVVDGETIATRKSLKLAYDDIEHVLVRRKQLAVQRHLRIAEQYIHYVGRGRFPYRDSR